MSATKVADGLLDLSYDDLANSQLSLYAGPIVEIRIGTATYRVSQALLCQHSPCFTAMFEGKFKEGETHSAELKEVEGVVSNRSFQMLLQCLYRDQLIPVDESPSDWIFALIESARLADMLGIEPVQSRISDRTRDIIAANPAPEGQSRNPETNVHVITPGSFLAAGHLPCGNPVRRILAKASVENYLNSKDFKFGKVLQEVPSFALEILQEVKVALESARWKYTDNYANCKKLHIEDGFSGKEIIFALANNA